MLTAGAVRRVEAMSSSAELPGGATRHPAAIYFRGVFVFMRSKFDRRRILPTAWIMDGTCGGRAGTLGFNLFRVVVTRAVGGWHS